jgi:hypothetical protein
LETLGRHLQLEALYGLTDNNPSRCSPRTLRSALRKIGVGFRIQYPGNYDETILRDAIKRDLGAAVGLRELNPGDGGHIVTLVDFADDTVRIIDSNDKSRRTRTLGREAFLDRWDGFALVLDPPDNAKKLAGAATSPDRNEYSKHSGSEPGQP